MHHGHHYTQTAMLQFHENMLIRSGILCENSFWPQQASFSMGYRGKTLTGYYDVIVCDRRNIKTYSESEWRSLYDRNLKNENMLKLKKSIF